MKQWLVTVLFVLLSGCEDALPEAAAPIESRVLTAAGPVFLVQENRKTKLVTGEMLKNGARIQTGTQGRALVRQSNGCEILLHSDTEATLKNGTVSLAFGEIFVETSAAGDIPVHITAGNRTVSATDGALNVAFKNDTLRVTVVRGPAVLSTATTRVEIETGEECVSEPGTPPAVHPSSYFSDWTGGMADRGAAADTAGFGRLLGIDPTRENAPPEPLQLRTLAVRIQVEGGIARTTVDQRFFNPQNQVLEGWYRFTVPMDATVDRFAVEMSGTLVEGEVVERQQAAEAYEESLRAALDPALLEWVDGRTYRTRIYPIPAAGERRVVLSYTEMLPLVNGVYRYTYPMGGNGDREIADFSLEATLDRRSGPGTVSVLKDARVENGGRLVTMRRSFFAPRSDFLMEIKKEEPPAPLRIARFSANENEADYVLLRWAPDIDWQSAATDRNDIVVVLDTSGGGDDGDKQIRMDTLEAVLRTLAPDDRFAVVAADLTARRVFPKQGLAAANRKNIDEAVERLSEIAPGGATDLGEMFQIALEPLQGGRQPAVVYVGDGRATVGELSNDALIARLRRSMGTSPARLFTVAVGKEAGHGLLSALAREGGGRAFQIDTSAEIMSRATALAGALKTPVITDLEIDAGAGLDRVFFATPNKIAEDGEAILSARTHHPLPDEITVRGRLGNRPFEKSYRVTADTGKEQSVLRTLWAGQYLRRLLEDGAEQNRGAVISLGLQYELMTPFTSFLVLENDGEYAARGIVRRRGPKHEGSPADTEKSPNRFVKYKLTEPNRSRGEEGQMGKRDSARTGKMSGIKGPPDPHMARSAASESGILSLLSDPNLPSSPYGASNGLGMDPENALGALMGDRPIGASFGDGGLSTQGTGRGGGGTGEGTIGLGALNTIGYGGLGTRRGNGHTGKAPEVRADPPVVKGGLSREIIRRIVRRHINEVRFCYERGLPKRDEPGGRVSIKFIIQNNGSVATAAVSQSTLGRSSVESCIAAAIERWTFPAPEGNGSVIVTQSFTLTPGNIAGNTAVIAENNEQAEEASPRPKRICSDASTRPLYERMLLWRWRLLPNFSPERSFRVVASAEHRCELKGIADTRALLDIIEAEVRDAEGVSQLLAAFNGRPSMAAYLRRRVLRRAFSPEVLFHAAIGGDSEMQSVARGLAAMKSDDARIAALKDLQKSRPADPIAGTLLVEVLMNAGRKAEAANLALRLKRDGVTTAMLLGLLCDLQADAGNNLEAARTCSELVELNENDGVAIMHLGEVFLRHGWVAAAYRQFKTEVNRTGAPLALLKLARAAAGMGRFDEALRIAKKTASLDMETADIPLKKWAELNAVVFLVDMIVDAEKQKNETTAQELRRALKRTQFLNGAGTVKILVWQDEAARLRFTETQNKHVLTPLRLIPAAPLGLSLMELPPNQAAALSVDLETPALRRDLPFTVYTLTPNGNDFVVEKTVGTLKALEKSTTIDAGPSPA